MTEFDYKSHQGTGAVICLIALIDCAITGSMVAAVIASVCILDCTLMRAIEVWEHKRS